VGREVAARFGVVLAAAMASGCAGGEPARSPDDARTSSAHVTRPALVWTDRTEIRDVPGVQNGLATWYGGKLAGRRTASGERFDPQAMTAAHLTLPLGTWVEVRRASDGRTVRVRINDRGPFGDPRRIIDLSKHAAQELGIVKRGTAEVSVRVIPPP
jgi:rare lipoprotein A